MKVYTSNLNWKKDLSLGEKVEISLNPPMKVNYQELNLLSDEDLEKEIKEEKTK